MRIAVRREDLIGRGGFSPSRRSAFIAYRMTVADSIAMNTELKTLLTKRGVQTVDGSVPYGDNWGPAIRDRINKSKIMVADITGPSREVMFEVGFAGNRVVMPIVATRPDLEKVPSWLRGVNIPTYSGAGVARVADLISSSLASGASAKKRQPPAPGRVLWIQAPEAADWVLRCKETVETWSNERGLLLTVVDYELYSREDLDDLHRSWLVVAAIDGSPQDYLSHYMLGDVAARRRAGSGGGKGQFINRLGILLTPPRAPLELHVATSVLQMRREIIQRATETNLKSCIHGAVANYQNWLRESDAYLSTLGPEELQ